MARKIGTVVTIKSCIIPYLIGAKCRIRRWIILLKPNVCGMVVHCSSPNYIHLHKRYYKFKTPLCNGADEILMFARVLLDLFKGVKFLCLACMLPLHLDTL